jgi:hypothetical protein
MQQFMDGHLEGAQRSNVDIQIADCKKVSKMTPGQRWYILKPKISICVNFGMQKFGIFCCHLEYIVYVVI